MKQEDFLLQQRLDRLQQHLDKAENAHRRLRLKLRALIDKLEVEHENWRPAKPRDSQCSFTLTAPRRMD